MISRFFISLLFLFLATGCVTRSFNTDDNSAGSETAADSSKIRVDSGQWYCPVGSVLDGKNLLCVNKYMVLKGKSSAPGPFTEKMIKECLAAYPGSDSVCQNKQFWPIDIAKKFAGTGQCLNGSVLQPNGLCKEGTSAYGPFTRDLVNFCAKYTVGNACYSMRIAWAHASSLLDQLAISKAMAKAAAIAAAKAAAKAAQGVPPKGTRASAFLNLIAHAEGTLDRYDYCYTYVVFHSYADHPRILNGPPSLRSDAAGRYQFLSTTWDPLRDQLGLKDFSPASQDKAARLLLSQLGVDPEKITDRASFEQAIYKTNSTWASLPGSQHDQPTIPMDKAWEIFKGSGG